MKEDAKTGRICVLGATGVIGMELVAHLLQAGQAVVAVVRDEAKLARGLKARAVQPTEEALTVLVADLFTETDAINPQLPEVLKDCASVFNCASPALSWIPCSRANREWGAPVSSLTRYLLGVATENDDGPHLVAICGPEHFEEHDGSVNPFRKVFSWTANALFPALRDNHDEVQLLLKSNQERWTVLRCGSIRPGTAESGDASKVQLDHQKDGSDY